ALVAEREVTHVGHEPTATGAGDRPRDQPLSDIHADHGRPRSDGGGGERAVATPRIQRPLVGETRPPQALVEDDAQAPAQVVGMVQALEAVGEALVEISGRLTRHDSRPSPGRGGRSPALPRTARTRYTGRRFTS